MNNKLKRTETVAGLAGGGKGESPSEGLTAAQEVALAALLEGATITEAATRAGVSRVTLWRWKKSDTAFIAAWNQRKGDLWQVCEHRLFKLSESAIECVERAIAGGDVKAALDVLRGVGFLNGKTPHVGPTTAEGITAQREEAAAWAKLM